MELIKYYRTLVWIPVLGLLAAIVISCESRQSTVIKAPATPEPTEHSVFLTKAQDAVQLDVLPEVANPKTKSDLNRYRLIVSRKGRLFSEILVDVVAAEVIEPWGGGKWHMEIFRSVAPEPEDWNGEM